jgi:hypothetical protein
MDHPTNHLTDEILFWPKINEKFLLHLNYSKKARLFACSIPAGIHMLAHGGQSRSSLRASACFSLFILSRICFAGLIACRDPSRLRHSSCRKQPWEAMQNERSVSVWTCVRFRTGIQSREMNLYALVLYYARHVKESVKNGMEEGRSGGLPGKVDKDEGRERDHRCRTGAPSHTALRPAAIQHRVLSLFL